MALGAFLRRVMIRTRRMTGQTERPGRHQTAHCFRFMARAAAGVGIDRTSMGLEDLRGLMTVRAGTGAASCRPMVIGVTRNTGGDLDRRL